MFWLIPAGAATAMVASDVACAAGHISMGTLRAIATATAVVWAVYYAVVAALISPECGFDASMLALAIAIIATSLAAVAYRKQTRQGPPGEGH